MDLNTPANLTRPGYYPDGASPSGNALPNIQTGLPGNAAVYGDSTSAEAALAEQFVTGNGFNQAQYTIPLAGTIITNQTVIKTSRMVLQARNGNVYISFGLVVGSALQPLVTGMRILQDQTLVVPGAGVIMAFSAQADPTNTTDALLYIQSISFCG